MVAISLSLQLISISVIVLRRTVIHDSVSGRNQWDNTYDYIVVGAGSAGSVVAHRLAEDCTTRVLLLEAGGPQSVVTDIPKNSRSLLNTDYNWGYHTVPQTWFTPYRVPVPRGRAIGGSSTINNMLYNRGNRRDYDLWVTEFGAYGWSYNELLYYFRKLENNTDYSLVAANPEYHGTGGPVKISSNPNPDPILRIHNQVLNDFGLPNTDINGPNQLGVTIAQSFIGDGIRSSTGNAYLEPNPFPKNLHIVTYAYVTKVLVNRINNKLMATGVEFAINDNIYHVMATREVILSAGAFNTPKILMLSGIGPKKHLTELGIPVVVDLPVGDYLQDHPTTSIYTTLHDEGLAAQPGAQLNVQQLYEELIEKTGPLSVLTGSVFFYTTSSINDKEWPNTYMYSIVEYESDLNNSVAEMPANRELWMKYFRPYLGRHLLLTSPHLSRVRSYGTVRLASTDPFEYPIIDPQFLAHPQDYKDMVKVIRFVLYFLTASRLSEYVSITPQPMPGCSYCPDCPLYECDSYIKCIIRETIKTGYHPCGSCRMGSADRPDVVVDERLRVKYVSRLRVVDASIIPQIINSNTNAIAIAIGEKGADLIKQDLAYLTYY